MKEESAMRIRIAVFTAMLLLVSITAWAQNANNLTAEEVKKRIEQPAKVLLVDVRTSQEYRQGHIPTAINIPPPQISSIQNHLPPEKSLPIIFYCRGYS
jgi:rhodanese-related sulfurtransferase